jgi:chloride channel protein, CIC family
VLLAVELLLFEWKPRSFVPVALASVTAAVVRRPLLGPGPLFPTPAHPPLVGAGALLGCVVVGLSAGVLSFLLTQSVYAAEDAFSRLPIHWMWWPVIGGLVVGLGGLIFPGALGVGYDTIGDLLRTRPTLELILGVLLVKSVIWAVSLGSGTSGGVLAPLLMMGCALGALEGRVLPHEGTGFWALVCMGAVLGGTMRSPFTGIVFALELTHDVNMLLPLLLAVVMAHAFTVLAMPRSILTEKVARRGHHLSREYEVDPLETVFVRDVMRTDVGAIPVRATPADVAARLGAIGDGWAHPFLPVVDDDGTLLGLVGRPALERWAAGAAAPGALAEIASPDGGVAHPDEPLRVLAARMATSGRTSFPVVERGPRHRLVGIVSLDDVLRGRIRLHDAETRREQPLRLSVSRRDASPGGRSGRQWPAHARR